MGDRLQREFYTRSTKIVGKELLGMKLYRKDDKELRKGKIIEVELYKGPEDKAAHTRNGKTGRNAVVWKRGGFVYMYLIYGIHWMLNIVTAREGVPECILIRAIDSSCCIDQVNGPGKLTDYLNIDEDFYGEDLVESNRIWLESNSSSEQSIIKTPRINIDYAGSPWIEKKWRFLLSNYEDKLPSF